MPNNSANGAGKKITLHNPKYPAKIAHMLRPTGNSIRIVGSFSIDGDDRTSVHPQLVHVIAPSAI